MSPSNELERRIEARSAIVGIVGLGYVGLPVAVTFAEAGFRVIGVDADEEKVALLAQGRSHIVDVQDARVQALVTDERLRVSSDFAPLKKADAILICVPTPITEGAPDLSRVVAATRAMASEISPGTVVVLESTTYPGSTEELLLPLLEESGLRVGEDLFLAFSPERIDPGNPNFGFSDIPKIVGGVDEPSTRVAAALYAQVVPKVVPVSSAKEAELAKLIENTFRHVNIALVNELAIYAHELGIDIWEALEAAATKPFGYMPFWPGPGWGGHCIPLDPSYLSWRVRRERAHEVRFVEVAQAVNSEMPRHVYERVSLLLNEQGRSVRNAKVLGVGVAYKPGVDDTREAGALKVLDRLFRNGADVAYHDPLVPELEIGGVTTSSIDFSPENVADYDIVVILVKQMDVDWKVLTEHARLIFDCCNALGMKNDRIVRL